MTAQPLYAGKSDRAKMALPVTAYPGKAVIRAVCDTLSPYRFATVMTTDLLITNCLLYTNITTASHASLHFIAISDGLIAQTGPMETCPVLPEVSTIDAKGCLAMPGLINGHCHAPMTLFRGMADDLALEQWLLEHIFPAEAKYVDEEMVYHCSRLAAAEMLLSGTTSVADGYFLEDTVAGAFADAGIRTVAAQAVIDFPAPGVPDPETNIQAAADFITTFKDRHPLISPAVFAHSPYTCSPKTLQQAKELTRQQNVPFFIHLAETRNELSQIQAPQGNTPTQHLDKLGILDENTICIHCVWLNDDDLDILSAAKSSIVVCPQSNMKLASGMAPLQKMIERNIPVGLGTDGSASNNTLDMFREMDICAKLQKLQQLDPVAVPAKTILDMGTSMGAKAIGLPAALGTLDSGSIADIILLDLKQPHLQPFYTEDTLVYSGTGSDVRTVIIQGRPVVHDRTILTFNLDQTLEEVRRLQVTKP